MEKQALFILSLFQHGDKVRYSTLSHLLRGKRTASVLMYGFLMELLPYFGLFPKLSEDRITRLILVLIEANLLLEEGPGLVRLSEKGRACLLEEPVIDHGGLNCLLYSRVDEDFAELLVFGSQVVSEYCHQQVAYHPIESSPLKQGLIKSWLRQLPARETLGPAFFQEWLQLMESFPPQYRPFVVAYLSGNQQIGQTTSQLAELATLSLFEVTLVKKQLIHLTIQALLREPQSFPFMHDLYKRLGKPVSNESALRTYQLFQAGWDIEALATKRRLKQSTVSEHLIEAAIIDPGFDFSRILTKGVKDHFTTLELNKVRNWRYSQLGTASESVSFLAFRCFQIQQVRGGNQ